MKFLNLATLFAASCQALPQHGGYPHGGKKAVYFLRVNPKGSSIVSIALNGAGQLIKSTKQTSTGGDGLQGQNFTSPSLAPAAFDPLQAQNPVTVSGDYLFTVNSGSNTAVMFKINPENPIELTMVGSPADTLGEFPMSIAYSSKYKKACVLNGGATNGVACYSVSATDGLVADGVGLREYGFSATTPPQLGGPSGSGSDIQFSVDETKVITTFKGSSKPATNGHITFIDVSSNGDVSKSFTDNEILPGAAFGFALNPRSPNDVYVSNAAIGGGNLVSYNSNTSKASILSTNNNTALFGTATCWAVYNEVTNDYYSISAGSAAMGVINSAGALTGTVTYSSTLGGGFDTVVDGPIAYFLTHTNTIAVLNQQSGKLLQTFTYGKAASRPQWAGMAIYGAEGSSW